MTVLLDTDRLSIAERADALHSVYADETPRRRVYIDGYPIRHRVEKVDLGPDVQLLRTGGSALHILRTHQDVREDAPEHLAIGLRRRGTGLVAAGSSPVELPVGHLNCVDMTSPYRLMHTSAHVHDVLLIDNQTAGVSVDVVRAARSQLRQSPVYALMASHLSHLFAASAALSTTTRALAGQSTVALTRALLTTAAASADSREAMDDSLVVQIEIYLDVHLHERDLTVQRVAGVHHISVRHLYNLWSRAGHEDTPAEWVARRRLERARDQLAAPGGASVAAIARASGFPDSSHFSRRFRRRYGLSPTEWRATHHPRP